MRDVEFFMCVITNSISFLLLLVTIFFIRTRTNTNTLSGTSYILDIYSPTPNMQDTCLRLPKPFKAVKEKAVDVNRPITEIALSTHDCTREMRRDS